MQLKKYLLIIIGFLSAIFAKAQSPKKLDSKTFQLVIQMDSVRQSNANLGAKKDSINKWNKELLKILILFAKKTPGFLQKEFPDWKTIGENNAAIYVTNSTDKKIKIVYWENGFGGSIKDFQYIIFWQKDNQLTYKIVDTSIANSYIDTIRHLKQENGDDLYFIISEFAGDINLYAMDVLCAKINSHGDLIENFPAFKTATKTFSHISVETNPMFYPYVALGDMIHFDKEGHTLYAQIIPDKKIYNNSDDTNKPRLYSVYQFDGNNFVHKKKYK